MRIYGWFVIGGGRIKKSTEFVILSIVHFSSLWKDIDGIHMNTDSSKLCAAISRELRARDFRFQNA